MNLAKYTLQIVKLYLSIIFSGFVYSVVLVYVLQIPLRDFSGVIDKFVYSLVEGVITVIVFFIILNLSSFLPFIKKYKFNALYLFLSGFIFTFLHYSLSYYYGIIASKMNYFEYIEYALIIIEYFLILLGLAYLFDFVKKKK
jgi:hypothetical protein